MTLMVFILLALVFVTSMWLSSRLCSNPYFLVPLDRSNERSLHSNPTPRTGGVAILVSLVMGLACSLMLEIAGVDLWSDGPQGLKSGTLWLVAIALFLGVMSYLDDLIQLHPGIRLAAQMLAATTVVLGAGLQITEIPIPLAGPVQLSWLSVPFSLLFLAWMTNLYNFMDGMDGFAGGMTVIGFGLLSGMAWTGGHMTMALISLYIVGASAGFLAFNIPPARIFMGDIGSIPLGFLAGAFTLVGVQGAIFDAWVPALIFSPFIVDATVTLLRRAVRGERIWLAHREHYYQRVVLAGWGHRKTVIAEYAVMVVTGITALLYVCASEAMRLVLIVGAVGLYVLLAWLVSTLEAQARIQCQR